MKSYGNMVVVLKEDNIDLTFLLPLDIRTPIPDNHVCFLLESW